MRIRKSKNRYEAERMCKKESETRRKKERNGETNRELIVLESK